MYWAHWQKPNDLHGSAIKKIFQRFLKEKSWIVYGKLLGSPFPGMHYLLCWCHKGVGKAYTLRRRGYAPCCVHCRNKAQGPGSDLIHVHVNHEQCGLWTRVLFLLKWCQYRSWLLFAVFLLHVPTLPATGHHPDALLLARRWPGWVLWAAVSFCRLLVPTFPRRCTEKEGRSTYLWNTLILPSLVWRFPLNRRLGA